MQWEKGRVSKDSDKFRNMAARSLRAARATSDAAFRQTCFGVAAIYKRLALEDEILRDDRQRSRPRKMEQLLPQAPLRSDNIPIVCEPGDTGPDAIAKAGGLHPTSVAA